MSEGRHRPPASTAPSQPQNIATAITEVSERATLLVREEIELAKAEVAEKAMKLARGAAVGVAAGVFFVMALLFVLIGCALLLYYYLPRQRLRLLLGLLRDGLILSARGPGRPDRRESPQTRRAAGADDGDRRGAQDPRDRQAPAMAPRRPRGPRAGPQAAGPASAAPDRAGRARDDRPRRRHAGGRGLMAQRTPAEIRDSIESNRMELGGLRPAAARRGRAPDRLARAHRAPPQRTDARRGRGRRPADRHAHAARRRRRCRAD